MFSTPFYLTYCKTDKIDKLKDTENLNSVNNKVEFMHQVIEYSLLSSANRSITKLTLYLGGKNTSINYKVEKKIRLLIFIQ